MAENKRSIHKASSLRSASSDTPEVNVSNSTSKEKAAQAFDNIRSAIATAKERKPKKEKIPATGSTYKLEQEKTARRNSFLKKAVPIAAVIVIALIVLLIVNSSTLKDVSNLTIDSTATTQTLKWSGASRGLTYEIYRAEGTDGQYRLIDSLTNGENGITYDSLSAGTLYRYLIVTVKNDSKRTEGASAESYTKPNPVTGASASPSGNSSLTVKWSLQGSATGYELKYGLYDNLRDAHSVIFSSEEASYDTSSGTYSYTISDLAVDETYYMSMKVISGENATDWSPVFEGTVAASAETAEINTDKPMIALTFDGGPDGDGYTARILDLLSEYGGHATFFQTGENAELHPELIARMVNEGHELGNHTYDESHVGSEVTADDILDANTAIEEAGGVAPLLFRAPQGNVTDDIIDTCTDAGMAIVLWSLDSYDWNTYDSNDIVERVEEYAEDGDIIQFRNIYEETADAMEEIVPYLVDEGYQLVTVSELIEAGTGSAPEAGTIYYSESDFE